MNNTFSEIATDLGRTVAEAKPLLAKLTNADTSARPNPKKWSRKEVLGHLLDSASNYSEGQVISFANCINQKNEAK